MPKSKEKKNNKKEISREKNVENVPKKMNSEYYPDTDEKPVDYNDKTKRWVEYERAEAKLRRSAKLSRSLDENINNEDEGTL